MKTITLQIDHNILKLKTQTEPPKSLDFIYDCLRHKKTFRLKGSSRNVMSALPKIADFISRFEFSFPCFLAFSVPFSNHALRDFKEEISNNLLRFCILFRFRELHFLRDR